VRKIASALCLTIALLAAGCGDEGALDIARDCPPEPTTVATTNPDCAGRDGLPDEPGDKGQGPFRPRGF
jgi:hypothetical protein